MDRLMVVWLIGHSTNFGAFSSFADDLKRDAYNEMADAEKLGRLTDGEVNFDYRIVDALLDPVLEMLLRENDVNRPSRNILH